ncbi:aminotransferase class III-fold pyridoxal phosphate-dependent enzyme [Robbsia sp. Bb-Pol-6]|uniref:Aminotransferase class III-fold pyridoxal phosphate-dependent enzyme n=1 Tax=Robbsia betulipollinis TaxID=2981849 RepID=A0ABT3ZNA6_9BURK|nr:aminotransferase class III-fold pyridoxal phosphate-dependent enzyme [Robbsia betulipollinis]MCY0388019.1 aminotransferase class III-fold pyridoxal phosphate-dependent enzyme [Robbsia betulipollinis]
MSVAPAFDAAAMSLSVDDAALLGRRAVLGPAYRLFYEKPFAPVRGLDVWLYDAAGRAYLDAYNNVPSVGHCHPRIVAALQRQATALNTHTRYLHESVVEYAERLVARFPAALDTVMFTCSGSEANDLALRIVHEATGRRGLIVTENAYHGVTAALADLSPSVQSRAYRGAAPGGAPALPLAPHVRTVRAPDVQRAGLRGAASGPDVAARFALDVRMAIADLQRGGVEPAALIVDTVFASDGIHTDPVGSLAAGAAVIREHGGLFVADEVQGGFGRTGGVWWAFERDGIVPDIVTLGKPMGAGHPVAGLVTRAELLADFGARRRYFNTFGGNTVSAAVGLAVLDVIEEEGLVERAGVVGAHLQERLAALALRHAEIAEVRGRGLYIGVALIDPDGGPGTERAIGVMNRLRERGILIGLCGLDSNVLKIRPPLTFGVDHADLLVGALDAALGEA